MAQNDHINQKLKRTITTPEGVILPVLLADRGDRLTAVLIDVVMIVLCLIAVAIVGGGIIFGVLGASRGSGTVYALMLLSWFLIRIFYFSYFELRGQGSTPGKRKIGLRVIDRSGGPLQPGSVFVRNIVREIELFMPLTLIFLSDIDNSIQSPEVLMALAWMTAFAAVPFINKDVMRVGDFLGGTWVVKSPKATLLSDVSATAVKSKPIIKNKYIKPGQNAEAPTATYQFSRDQLEIYGNFELQTLEQVLRQTGLEQIQTMGAVGQKVRKKIGWPSTTVVNNHVFLKDFYAALRAHLETRMQFGEVRANKFDKPNPKNKKPVKTN